MLAEPLEGNPRFPVLASPKLDGIRAVNINGALFSRKMKPIPNPFVQRLFGIEFLHGLDGELMVGTTFGTSQAVMRKRDEPLNVTWNIFDKWNDPRGFQDRFMELVPYSLYPQIKIVEHVRIDTQDELDAYEAKCLGEGYEGIMIRDPQGPYKQGRSTNREGWLLKVKRFVDSEAEIIGFEEEMRNTNEAQVSETGHTKRSSKQEGLVGKDTLGSLIVKDVVTGVEFNIGSGFTAEQRSSLWQGREFLYGQIVTYKFQPTGIKERPRFPIFKGFRDKDDM